ncbi:MAG: hypothetical protein WA765_18645 [Candidatus Acidiferrum sp.]
MNRATIFLLGSLMLLLSCSAAHGQGCATILQPHFSVYNSSAGDGYNIYTSVSIQGYASIGSSAGCNMSSAKHHVGAENKLNNVDHWTYSATACPSCYFSATDNEQIVGVPGVEYPWDWEGEAICSIVGNFWGGGGGGSLPGCLVPSTETTALVGSIDSTYSQFNQTIGDTASDSFDTMQVDESNAATGQDTCWFAGSKYAAETGVSGGLWTVAGDDVQGQHNHWGYDTVGWSSAEVSYYRANDPAHGIGIPCGWTLYQAMNIQCSAGAWWTYTPSYGNKLTATIDQSNVVNCRYDINGSACQTITY